VEVGGLHADWVCHDELTGCEGGVVRSLRSDRCDGRVGGVGGGGARALAVAAAVAAPVWRRGLPAAADVRPWGEDLRSGWHVRKQLQAGRFMTVSIAERPHSNYE
jgi:hypothetical protein